VVEPAGQNSSGAEAAGFLGEKDEDGLGDFARERVVAGEPPGGGPDEVDVARHERGKGGFVGGEGETGQQFVVGQFSHSQNNVRRMRNRTDYLKRFGR